jgi:hypothetical protein
MVTDTRRTADTSVYRPRNPKASPLWRILNAHFDEFLSVYEERFEPRYGRLPPHVESVVRRYLQCGDLSCGFARLKCRGCGRERFLPYSCKSAACPSCRKKKQILFGEFVVQHVFENVPHRQTVLALPKRIRPYFFRDKRLLPKLARAGWETIRDLLQEALGRDDVVPGAVISIQTFGSLLDRNCHLHCISTWGCFDAEGRFFPVHEVPDNEIIEKLFRHKVFRMLLDEGAVTEDLVDGMIQWHHTGFSAHVGNAIPGDDRQGLESLAQYVARGPVALERMAVAEDGEDDSRIIYRSNRFHPGRRANFRVFLDPLEFIAEIAAQIPAKYAKSILYYGWYASRARGDRAKKSATAPAKSQAEIVAETEEKAPLSLRRTWARLIAKVYESDPLICECGSEMYVVSLIHDPEVIYRILSHLDLLEDEPQAGAGRSPPCRADHSPGELICEPFFDDLPAGELDEDLYRSIVDVAANN